MTSKYGMGEDSITARVLSTLYEGVSKAGTGSVAYMGYTGYTEEESTLAERTEVGTQGGTERGSTSHRHIGIGTSLGTEYTRHTRNSDSHTDAGTEDPYSTGSVKFTPLHELTLRTSYAAAAYGDYDTASAAGSDSYLSKATYSIIGINSTNIGEADFTTISNNDTMLNLTDVHLPSLISLTYPSMPAMVIVGTLLIGLAVATAFGNFLVGLALFKFRNLRTVSNYLIGNLALSDLLLALTILPLSAVQECLGHWVFGQVMCYFWLCTDVLYCTASIWNLCIIAFDRFTATLYPVWYREKRSPRQAAIYIGIVWIFSAAICIPPLLGWNDLSGSFIYDNTTNVYQCVLFQTPSYVVYSAMGSFYIPFMFTVFLYIRIFGVLYARMKKLRASERMRKKMAAKLSAAPPAPFSHATAAATNPLCVKEETPTNTPQQDIELAQVVPGQEASGNTEEISSKSLFGSDSPSDEEEDSSSTPHIKEDVTEKLVNNGMHHKHKQHKERGDKSETMVIFNPNHNFTTDSEKDDVKIVVCGDKNGKSGKVSKNNNVTAVVPDSQVDGGVTNGGGMKRDGSDKKKKNISTVISKPITIVKAPKKKRTSVRKRHDQREMRATIRMAIIIAFFCGCWIGFFTSYLVRGIIGEENFYMPRGLDAFFFWLGYSNSAMNPILYTIFNDDFRKAFQKILGCYSKARHGSGPAYGKARS